MTHLELLSPAKDADHGIAAINHGADAVYIGAPQFGARVAASNSLDDMERLVKYAHLFGAKVFATVNTLLYDHELEPARQMIWQLYQMGVDALIVQDLGLLELDLPPIALHASTQAHNYDISRIKLMESAGFARIILARECSLDRMREIRSSVGCELEAFVQGALCVSFSGQCYLSQYLNDRSGNRGCCSQPCRSSYDLLDADGRILQRDKHLLSLKDFSAAQHLESMIDAGIKSFKIEGRLKDIGYVKNLTAHYRRLLDGIMRRRSDLAPASCGQVELRFTPDPERTFNRGFTTYFLSGQRTPMASFHTQKSIGKRVATVLGVEGKRIIVSSQETFVNGDGLCLFSDEGALEGFLVNAAERADARTWRITPHRLPACVRKGLPIYRNNDVSFERALLSPHSGQRRISLSLRLEVEDGQCRLWGTAEGGAEASVALPERVERADNQERMARQWSDQLSKLGDTPFLLSRLRLPTELPFLPVARINWLRRTLAERLCQALEEARRPSPVERKEGVPVAVDSHLDYRANVLNHKSEQFYRRHGAQTIEPGLEQSHDYQGRALMTTKYCLRHELGLCLLDPATRYRGPLFLRNNRQRFLLQFDCQRCEMRLLAALPQITHQ